jgi:hypothetical protein
MSAAAEKIFASSRHRERRIEMRRPSKRATLSPTIALPSVACPRDACITGQYRRPSSQTANVTSVSSSGPSAIAAPTRSAAQTRKTMAESASKATNRTQNPPYCVPVGSDIFV